MNDNSKTKAYHAKKLRHFIIAAIISVGLVGPAVQWSITTTSAAAEAAPVEPLWEIDLASAAYPSEGACIPAAQHLWLGRPFVNAENHPLEDTFLYGILGAGRCGLHTGVDIRGALGTPVVAGAGGRIIYAGDDSTQRFGPQLNYYGKLVLMEVERDSGEQIVSVPDVSTCEPDPVYVLYAHLDRLSVQTGQLVHSGDILGSVGMTGIAIGPHLHLEVRSGDSDFAATRNPSLWLSPIAGQGAIVGKLVDASGNHVADSRILLYKVETEDRLWRVPHTYPVDPLINHDSTLQESFALTDVPPGEYRVVAGQIPKVVRLSLTVKPDRMTFVELTIPK